MITSQSADEEINQAIERLKEKMQSVSENLGRGHNRMRSAQKKGKARSRQRGGKGSAGKLIKYFFIFLLLGATSLVIAQIATGYISNLDKTKTLQPANISQDGRTDGRNIQQPAVDIQQSGDIDAPKVSAKFSMQAANYDIVESELGPVLDIAITVANVGGAAGRPELFEIELVDDTNKQLMKWPMAISGASILPQQQMVYKTRLVEPPKNFKNIRVTMKK